MLFFCKGTTDDVPERIRRLLKEYEERVLWVNSKEALGSPHLRHGDKLHDAANGSDLLNCWGHFNAKGNQLYAEAVLEILKGPRWGEGDRVFEFSEEANAFQNIMEK